MRPRAFFLGGLLAVLFATFAFGSAKPDFAAQLAEASRLADENSWALARDAYTEAQKLAPNAEAKRWCELWTADMAWRTARVPVWSPDERVRWREKYQEPVEVLLGPYTRGAPKDSFWVAGTKVLAEMIERGVDGDPWPLWHDIADFLAGQTPSAKAVERYVRYLQGLKRSPLSSSASRVAELSNHFARAAELTTDAIERVDLLLTALRLADDWSMSGANQGRGSGDVRSLWARALALVRDTRGANVIRAEYFLWQMRRNQPDEAAGSSVDFPALLGSLRTHQEAVQTKDGANGVPQAGPTLVALEQLKQSWTRPVKIISMGPVIRPDQPVEVSVGSANVSNLSLCLRRHSPEALVRWLRLRLREDRDVSSGETVRAWTVAVSNSGQHEWHADILPVASALEPGVYSLTAAAEGTDDEYENVRMFLVTSLSAMQVATGLGSTELFVHVTGTGEPVAHAQVRGAFSFSRRESVQTWEGATDAQGRVRLPDVDWRRTLYESACLAALVNGQPVVLQGERDLPPPPSAHEGAMDVFFDRKLYRTGETIHWKAIVREHREGRFAIPDWRLELQVDHEDEELGDLQEFALSSFGTAHGEFVIPTTTRPGRMNFNFDVKDADGESPGGDRLFVWIDNFIPPAIRARVTFPSGPESLRPGSEVTARVQADYYSGGPVSGAHVACRFEVEPLRGFGNDAETSDEVSAWLAQLRDHPLTGVTGADGGAEFHLALRSDLPAPATLRAKVDVMPDGGIAAWAGMQGRVTKAGFLASGEPNGPAVVAPGEVRSFSWKVTDGFGEPATFRGEVRLVELRWVEAWLDANGKIVTGSDVIAAQRPSLVDGDAEPPGNWRKLHSGYVTSVVATEPVTTGADGAIQVSFVLPRAGIYRAELVRDGTVVPPPEPEWDDLPRAVFAVAKDTADLAFDPRRTAIIPTDPWRRGAPLRLFVVLPERRSVGILALAGGDEVQTTRVDLNGRRVGFVTVDQPPVPIGELQASLGVLEGEDRRECDPVGIPITDHTSPLEIVLAPNDKSARPGARSSLIARVRDVAGHPVRAELALAATDEAVNQLWSAEADDDIAFSNFKRTVGVGFALSARMPDGVLLPLNDPRPGVSRSRFWELNELRLLENVVGDRGVYAEPPVTLAGNVTHAPLRDVSNAVDVVTEQLLREIGAHGSDNLLGGANNGDDVGHGSRGTRAPIVVRQHFSSTALWSPELVTNAGGEAEIEFTYPDNLTQWRVAAYAVGEDGASFQRAHTFTRTSLPLQARLQTPRVLVAGDVAEPSAWLVNRTNEIMSADTRLFLRGPVEAVDPNSLQQGGVLVPADSETHLDWTIRATTAGEAALAFTGRGGDESDAMVTRVPVHDDGLLQQTASSGRLAPGERMRQLKLPLPAKRERTRADVTIQLSASYAATLLDALPYLIDYPYGCVEQTMNRFLPAVVVKKALGDFGLEPGAIENRVLANEATDEARRRAGSVGLVKLDDVVAQSLVRLAGARIEKNGFGWWPGTKTADLWMTAYVAWGLVIARETGTAVPDELMDGTTEALGKLVQGIEIPDDRLAWALAALARAGGNDDEIPKTFVRTYVTRAQLSAAGRACLALAAMKFGDDEQRAVLLRNLENGAQRVKADDLGDTVRWGATGNYWRAMDGAVESTALTLLALLELDPKHALIETAANWLVLNRRSAHWASTRDTAFAILALTKYIKARGELDADAEVDVFANGKKVQRVKFTRESLLTGDTTIAIDPKLLRGGNNTIELRRVGGKSPVYAVALATSWARGDAVKPQGHLINVARGFVRQKQEPTLLGTLRITPEPLPADGKANAAVTGEQVTARVTLNVPNELEYVMVAVPKPAGCEPLNPLSGYDATLRRVTDAASAWRAGLPVRRENGSAGASPSIPEEEGRPIYREEHDDKSVFFIDSLAAGTWEIVFNLRATTPGNYRALPAEASAMYVPEVRANSDAQRVRIERRTEQN